MNQDEVQKKDSREKYQKEIAQELNIELDRYGDSSKTTPVLKRIKFVGDGEMSCDIPIQPKTAPDYYEPFNESKILIKFLVNKLVNTKIELCNQKQKTEERKNQLTKAKKVINEELERLTEK